MDQLTKCGLWSVALLALWIAAAFLIATSPTSGWGWFASVAGWQCLERMGRHA